MTLAAAPQYISRSPDHRYTFDDVTYPGVTSILKVLDKSDALMGWAARNTAEAAVALGDTFPQLLASVGPEGVVKALTARSAWKRDEAAALGTDVHNMADIIATGGTLPPMSPATLQRVDTYERWWRASGWTLRASEALLVNPAAGYGGTLDLLCYDRHGRTVLADIKTGKAVYGEAVLQLAAYGASTWLETSGRLYGMPAVDRYVILHSTAEGLRKVEVSVGQIEREAFLACLQLSRWRNTMKGKRL
jgi:hypothetical protein